MTILDVSYAGWMDQAMCAGSEVNFFPEKGETAAEAREVCKDCPVRAACLQWALDNGEEHGVFGGLAPRDRRKLRPKTSAWQCAACRRSFRTQKGLIIHRDRQCGVPRVHGTNGAYANGCRCEPCTSGRTKYQRERRQARRAARGAAA